MCSFPYIYQFVFFGDFGCVSGGKEGRGGREGVTAIIWTQQVPITTPLPPTPHPPPTPTHACKGQGPTADEYKNAFFVGEVKLTRGMMTSSIILDWTYSLLKGQSSLVHGDHEVNDYTDMQFSSRTQIKSFITVLLP